MKIMEADGRIKMIKIIKLGTKKEVECTKCGALLSYDEKEDVQTGKERSFSCYQYYMRPYHYIICPQCKHEIVLDATR